MLWLFILNVQVPYNLDMPEIEGSNEQFQLVNTLFC